MDIIVVVCGFFDLFSSLDRRFQKLEIIHLFTAFIFLIEVGYIVKRLIDFIFLRAEIALLFLEL